MPQMANPYLQCFACGQMGHYARECLAVQTARMQQLIVTPVTQDNKVAHNYFGVKFTSNQLQNIDRLGKRAVHGKLKTRRKNKRRRVVTEGPTTPIQVTQEVKPINGEEEEGNKETTNTSEPMKEVGVLGVVGDKDEGGESDNVRRMDKQDYSSVKEREVVVNKLSREERQQFTAAFTTVKIQGRTIRTLADSGASHSAIASSWVKHLNLEQLIRPSDIKLVDAQKEAITIQGEIDIPVEFGKKEFIWTFAVADNLFCPLILGMDVLHKGCLNFNKKRIKIQGETMPVTFNLRELRQFTVIALMNRVIPTQKVVKIKGKVIRDTIPNTNLQSHTYIVNTSGMMVDSVLTKSEIRKDTKGREEECITLLAINPTYNKRQIKRGDILATLEIFREDEMEVLYRDSPKSGSPRSRATSITNRDEEEIYTHPIHPIASIVAIKSRQSPGGEKVRDCISVGGGNNNTICQPESKGGVDGVAFVQPVEVVSEHNKEVSSTTMSIEGVGQLSNCPSIIGLKVPLVVREKVDSTVGGSGQPESKGGPATLDSPRKMWEDWVSDRMEESDVVTSEVSPSDPGTITIDEVAPDQPCVHVSPVQHGNSQQSGVGGTIVHPACCNTIVQDPVPKGMECINSQEMLYKGDQVLMEQLIEERNKGQKTIYKGAEQEIIKEMVKESKCSNEQKRQLAELLTNNKEILVPGLTSEFTGGNAFFQPHQDQVDT